MKKHTFLLLTGFACGVAVCAVVQQLLDRNDHFGEEVTLQPSTPQIQEDVEFDVIPVDVGLGQEKTETFQKIAERHRSAAAAMASSQTPPSEPLSHDEDFEQMDRDLDELLK